MRILGTPNLQTKFRQKSFFTDYEVMVARGFASIHLVKYSIATTANLFPPYEGGKGPIRSIPHLCNGQVGDISYVAAEGLALWGEVF